ncbi:MAG: D-alanyl-D-alanine carboxypeptidase [Solobacterium sp.]|nr:D-alanyl-D-alanine carboxypeptidase [Solobacterium sp.]
MKKITVIILQFLLVFSVTGITPVHAEEDILAGIVSDNVIVVETGTGEILAEKNSREQIAPASMTKMLTGIVAIEELPDLHQNIKVTDRMLAGLIEANASTAGLALGEEPTVEELLYCLALPSGADAANTLALTVSEDMDHFIDKMNEKAQEIGMKDSHFANPTGLDAEGQYTTCYDMYLLLNYCIQNDTFREVYSTETYTTGPLLYHSSGLKVTSTFLKDMHSSFDAPGFIGGKTGYTGNAGHCLASWSHINNMDIIIVTAHAMTAYTEKTHLSDTAAIVKTLNDWEIRDLVKEGDLLQTITVKSQYKEETIEIRAPETITDILPKNTVTELEITFPEEVRTGLNASEQTGYFRILNNGDSVYSTEIFYRVPKETNFFARIGLRFSEMTKGCRN